MNRVRLTFGLGPAVLAIFVLWLPGVGNAYVTPATADFGEVAFGSENVIPLTITNTTVNSYILYFQFNNYSCGFTVNKQEVYLGPNGTLDVEVRWAPEEETTCSAILRVTSGQETLEEVPVAGTAIPPDQEKDLDVTPDTPETIWIGECDTGIGDREHGEGVVSHLFDSCLAGPTNHGEFVRCVVTLANDLRKEGAIDQKEHAAIKRCAARSEIPAPQPGEAN